MNNFYIVKNDGRSVWAERGLKLICDGIYDHDFRRSVWAGRGLKPEIIPLERIDHLVAPYSREC